MINGLPIGQQPIASNKTYQQTMERIIDCSLAQQNTSELPPYIANLLMYHDYYVSKSVIKLDFYDLINGCIWMHSKFVKQDNNEQILLSISNICMIFSNADEIIFSMPENYILNETECESLIRDLELISEMCIMTKIRFKWPSEISMKNKGNINKYLRELLQVHWRRIFFTDSVVFECEEISYNFAAQSLFQTQATQMISVKQNVAATIPTVPTKKKLHVIVITKKMIRAEYVYTVEGFLRDNKMKNVYSDVLELLLFFYAKPIIMKVKYKSQIKSILICPVEVAWMFLENSILQAYKLSRYEYKGGLQSFNGKYGTVTRSNWTQFRWDKDDLFTLNLIKQTNSEKTEDEVIIFEPPENSNTIPHNMNTKRVPEWFMESSKTCIIPNIGYIKKMKQEQKVREKQFKMTDDDYKKA
eukprot:351990_1